MYKQINRLKIMNKIIKFGKPVGVTRQKVISFSNHHENGNSKNKANDSIYAS